MDNETTYLKLPSNSIERIVLYIYDIVERIIQTRDSAFIINSEYQKKQDLIVKIKEIVDINIIDGKVEKLKDDFSKIFKIKNKYPNLLLKINRILLIFNEEKIKKIYELVKYIANIETSKLNTIELFSKVQTSNNKNCSNLEEMKKNEKNQSCQNREISNPINYTKISNLNEYHPKYYFQTKSDTESQYNCDSFGTNKSNLYPEMINIKSIKEKETQHCSNRNDISNYDEFHKNKNINQNNIILENWNKNKNKPPLLNKNKFIVLSKNTFKISKENEKEINKNEKKIKRISNNTIIDKHKNSYDDLKNKESEIIAYPNIKSIGIPNSKEQFFKNSNSDSSNFIEAKNETLNFLGKKLKRNKKNSKQKKMLYNKYKILNGKSSYVKIKDTNQNTPIEKSELNNISNSFEDIFRDYGDKNHNKINNIPFYKKLKENALNFECYNENSEDFINFDNLSAGIFSNKEITFDENHNSINEENNIRKFEDIGSNKNEIEENIKGLGDDLHNKINNFTKNSTSSKENYISTYKNKTKIEATQNNLINENDYFLENKNINFFKNFFMNKNTKNDGKTINSIDYSTTVSTQFTKEKNSFKNFKEDKEELNIKKEEDTNNNDNIKEFEFLYKKNKFLCNNIPSNKHNSQRSQFNIGYKNPQNIIKENYNNLGSNNNNSNMKGKILPKYDINLKNQKNVVLTNNFENSIYNNIITENSFNKFTIENDFERNINSEGDRDILSNDIFKNLLATAKYFNLD